jgi:hypothetical protein
MWDRIDTPLVSVHERLFVTSATLGPSIRPNGGPSVSAEGGDEQRDRGPRPEHRRPWAPREPCTPLGSNVGQELYNPSRISEGSARFTKIRGAVVANGQGVRADQNAELPFTDRW